MISSLTQRVLTAVVLAPIAIAAILFLPAEQFRYFVAAVILLGAYEWANMSGISGRLFKGWFTLFIAVLIAILIVLVDTESIWLQGEELNGIYFFILQISVLWWLFSLFMIIAYPKYSHFWKNSRSIRACFGVLTLIPTWVALVTLRTSLVEVDYYGASLLFYVLGIVWAADIGAFFVGVKFGKHKLRPNVSPGKTLEGLFGGVMASFAIIAFAALHFSTDPSLIWLHLLIGGITVGVSALGDLNESMIKRCAGIKDSGKILPGHGGVMDRIDSLTAAFPVFAFCYVVWMA
ncbi:phosphatidate cytidylyltransferase [Glaciecola petra]|uniref:Phosphatidate cytidylyltransferase n=1 Tax=Glaciecola petra TaxID=3075602 RepID=A0ABU2ZM42_9ALTE|nr:phosphatidate cytidylyltransferase [Aestuariibacter sp. P117]MDT0593700.1 phosphatidate cytidylyltransferase [Aestuariibacter sp. P117]